MWRSCLHRPAKFHLATLVFHKVIRRAMSNISPHGCTTSRLHPVTPVHYYKNGCHGNVRKINCRLTIYSHSSTSPENLARIDPVDSEIIGLTGIANKQIRNIGRKYSPQICFQELGGLNDRQTNRIALHLSNQTD